MVRTVAMCAVLLAVVAVMAPSAAAARVLAMAPAGASAAEEKCDVEKLISSAPAIIGGTTPTDTCCSNLKAQESCFCQYAKDPAYSDYINSPNARKTLDSCGITFPSC